MTIDLDALEKLAAEATPGEWKVAGREYSYDEDNIISVGAGVRGYQTVLSGMPIEGYNPPLTGEDADKSFVVALRNAFPALAAELKELRAALATVEAEAYERAAKVCEGEARDRDDPEGINAAGLCAIRIRAIRPTRGG